MNSDYKCSWYSEPYPVRRKLGPTSAQPVQPYTWGEEEFKGRALAEHGIALALVEDLDNRKLSVVTSGGVEYRIRVSVELVKV